MKVTALYVYPIKALCGIPLETATLGPQGILHDRTFMLFKIDEATVSTANGTAAPRGDQTNRGRSGSRLTKLQLDKFAQCALFHQVFSLDGESVVVTYDIRANGTTPVHALQHESLVVPLVPDVIALGLEKVNVDLHGSPTTAYRMGGQWDAWFSACMGFPTMLVYIGDGRRAVLGTLSPQVRRRKASERQEKDEGNLKAGGWLGSLSSLVPASLWSASHVQHQEGEKQDEDWLTFTDVAPLLVASEASLRAVQALLPPGTPEIPIVKFRPNIVVDGEEAWSEDFWGELNLVHGPDVTCQTSSDIVDADEADTNGGENGYANGEGGNAITGKTSFNRAPRHEHTLQLTANCGRCTSINVDYSTGRPALGDEGTVLKRLMASRRVDPGHKYAPIFGRYAFLDSRRDSTAITAVGRGSKQGTFRLSVGDEVVVASRLEKRTVFDWAI